MGSNGNAEALSSHGLHSRGRHHQGSSFLGRRSPAIATAVGSEPDAIPTSGPPGPREAGLLTSALFYGVFSSPSWRRAAHLGPRDYCLHALLPVTPVPSIGVFTRPFQVSLHQLCHRWSPLWKSPQGCKLLPPGPTEGAHTFSPLSCPSCLPHPLSQRENRGLSFSFIIPSEKVLSDSIVIKCVCV